MNKLLTLLILISIGCNSQSKKNILDESAMPLINAFFKTLQEKKPMAGLEELLGANPNINPKDSATLNLKNSFQFINEASGSFMGFRLLKKRSLENDLIIYSYLAKYDKKFYRFVFMFYNNGSNTKLYKFLFDDDLDEELEGSLRFYSDN